MKISYLLFGFVFAIILIKVEAVSWFRIQEMFLFESFHMYGVLFSGIGVALFGIQLIKLNDRNKPEKEKIPFSKKPLRIKANLVGGILFGLGWAITGACPGPIYALIGTGIFPAVFILIGALLGAYVYLQLKKSKI